MTYDGGIQILDGTTLELVADIPLDGFNRINPAGDERHLMVSTTGGFQVLDMGVWGEQHGDHMHYYSTEPALLDVTYPATKPGHVVVHEGRTVLFDDGTGQISAIDATAIADAAAEVTSSATTAVHHGVAVELSNGSLLLTEGTEEARTGVRVLDTDGVETTASNDCPGIHGETVAAHEAVLFGCENGALVYEGGELTKIPSPDEYGRIGTLRGTESSDIALGDYNSDPEGHLQNQVVLVDTHALTLTVVDLGTEYTFRSLAMTDHGDALVLGTDGAIHVIDTATASVERIIDVIGAWEVPEDWQAPRPLISLAGHTAYVSDPATNRIVAVDIESGEVLREATLTVAPNEFAGVSGGVPGEGDGHGEDDQGDGDHGDEDHTH